MVPHVLRATDAMKPMVRLFPRLRVARVRQGEQPEVHHSRGGSHGTAEPSLALENVPLPLRPRTRDRRVPGPDASTNRAQARRRAGDDVGTVTHVLAAHP